MDSVVSTVIGCHRGAEPLLPTLVRESTRVWQCEALGLCFPVVPLGSHVAQGTLQVGDPLLCGLEPDRGDWIGVGGLERGLCVNREGAG